eukprot:gene23504-biopygen8368
MRCFVDTAGNCLVKCFSATCDNHAPACIGRLAEPAGDAWDAGAVHVNSRYIDIDACLEMQQAVDVWLDTERKDVNTLSVRSPMGLAEHTCMRYLTSGFDIVVLDEVEALLRHFMSPTVVNPFAEIQGLADTLNATTTGVVTMDATWGSVTKEFLKQAGLRNLLVVNDYRSTENARTFAISKDEVTWSAQIRDDIIAGRNVVVVSLSQERAMQVHKAALDTFDDPKDAARLCLLHTSKTADAVKAKLIDVDALWSSKRIVVYTPTISAGIDFSTQHFDRMYLYLCPGSAAPMGALQMTGRVRHLVDTDVRTLVAKNMRVARDATRQHLTHVDLYQWLRWMEGFATCLEVKHVPAIDGGDYHTLQELSGGALAPSFATVAPPTLKMTVKSYFLAEIYNASFDYVSCFADLLEHAGHRVDLGTSYAAVSAARVHAPAEGDVEATSEFLLRVLKAQEQLDALTRAVPVAVAAPDNVHVAAPVPVAATDILSDVPSAMRRKDLMDAIEQRVMANDASEDDKFLLYLSRYCSAWGIDRVDEEFLLENKPGAVGSPKARLLSRLLCPILRPVQEELGLNQQDVFGGSFLQGVPRVQAALLDDLRQLDNVSNSRLMHGDAQICTGRMEQMDIKKVKIGGSSMMGISTSVDGAWEFLIIKIGPNTNKTYGPWVQKSPNGEGAYTITLTKILELDDLDNVWAFSITSEDGANEVVRVTLAHYCDMETTHLAVQHNGGAVPVDKDGSPCSRILTNGRKYCHDHVKDSFKEESSASEEPMTATVEDYDALLLELENCRIKNQTLIKHNDELKLISETTMHENILLKNQLVPELSPYHFGHDLLTSLNLPFCNTKCCIVLLGSSGARQCKNNRHATGLLCTTHASPKHIAEKVNKAYATRCVERHAKVISAYQTQSECVATYNSACEDKYNYSAAAAPAPSSFSS